MRYIVIIAAAGLCSGLPACAQTSESIAVAPPARSTGPTVQDTRQLDQASALPPSSSTIAPATGNSIGYGNWRTSDGLNADPNNPNGAPGPSWVGTNAAR
jgi:hypothetical protein